ncbi:unnamed protein product [Meloidogyne enterolobii]|uniref:Uncharacterized protein n=1 Tax=Meloidogyne enterolobii TaxID=390850 RepID=A0ACB0ZA13_MELEN
MIGEIYLIIYYTFIYLYFYILLSILSYSSHKYSPSLLSVFYLSKKKGHQRIANNRSQNIREVANTFPLIKANILFLFRSGASIPTATSTLWRLVWRGFGLIFFC